MSLRIIGAGFGRTGTLSLKVALERLGFGPCYHMLEVTQNPGHADLWHDAARGVEVDWHGLFARYQATVDWPACTFWQPLMRAFPEAKVLLSVRPAEDWYRSVANTIHPLLVAERAVEDETLASQREMARRLVLENTFDGRFEDRSHAIAVYERHNDAVRQAVPPEQLLVYEVGSGWEPLCDFFDYPVPAEPYPHVNTTEQFNLMIASR